MIVVLGMHRAGTSLVASLLQAMGVNMGSRLLGPSDANPYGHFEDLDFVDHNRLILGLVGGTWKTPPHPTAIAFASDSLICTTAYLVSKHQEPWGWKDPRTCLTIGAYHPFLENPRYVWVQRDKDAIVTSLLKRSKGTASQWIALVDEYERRIAEFLATVDAPVLTIRYESLLDGAAQELAEFVGVTCTEDVLDLIKPQAVCPGFGKVAFGVPYYRMPYYSWRWVSWLLINGFELGDVFLNDEDVPGEVPIPIAHNALADAFLDTDCDTLCIIEDDHVGDQEVVRNMRYKRENWEYDIVCASYTNRRSRPLPTGWNLTGVQSERGYQVQFELHKVELEGTQEYDGAALGLVFIRRSVLEELGPYRFQWTRANSQDIEFYVQAHAKGFKTGVDRDSWIGHVGQKVWTKEDFIEWRATAEKHLADG